METGRRPELVVYGAGNIGRGIVSLLFQNAGYRLCFYRRSSGALLEMQRQGGYWISVQGGGEGPAVRVKDFEVIPDEAALVGALARCDMAACCLYPAAFPQAAQVLAQVCRVRTAPLDLLLCCNEPGGSGELRDLTAQALEGQGWGELLSGLYIVPAVVSSVGFPTPGGGPWDVTVSAGGTLEAERGAFSGTPPEVPGLKLTEGIDARLSRKLYLGNMFYTYAALLGDRVGYTTMAQCCADGGIRCAAEEAFCQSEAAVLRTWSFQAEEHAGWRAMMLGKMDHPAQDPVGRILQDLPRKLRRGDRLVGPALLCVQTGCGAARLVHAVCLALERLGRQDPGFGAQLRGDTAGTVYACCGLSPEDAAQRELAERIVSRLSAGTNMEKAGEGRL